jgi:hypothetical protein
MNAPLVSTHAYEHVMVAVAVDHNLPGDIAVSIRNARVIAEYPLDDVSKIG